MEIKIRRLYFTDQSTIGDMSLDGVYECHTLEDRWRLGSKVKGSTCIPCGRYKVVIDMSQRFGRLMPHLLDVPSFDGIRIHSGNDAADTEGCILVGQSRALDWVGESRLAFDAFFPKLQQALAAGDVWCSITNG